jgi:hypothetical protein
MQANESVQRFPVCEKRLMGAARQAVTLTFENFEFEGGPMCTCCPALDITQFPGMSVPPTWPVCPVCPVGDGRPTRR